MGGGESASPISLLTRKINARADASDSGVRLFPHLASGRHAIPSLGLNVEESGIVKNYRDPLVSYGIALGDDDGDAAAEMPKQIDWQWDFAGSVSGEVKGQRAAFTMNTIDHSWSASVMFKYESEHVNATLAATGSSSSTLKCDDVETKPTTPPLAGGSSAATVKGTVAFALPGGSHASGTAEGTHDCEAENVWSIKANIDSGAKFPIGGVGEVELGNVSLSLDGQAQVQSKKKKDADLKSVGDVEEAHDTAKPHDEANLLAVDPNVTGATSLGRALLADAAAAPPAPLAKDANATKDPEKQLNWKIALVGSGGVKFGGGDNADEDAFLNDNFAGNVAVTLNAHTEAEAKGLIVDKALLRGDMQYESPNGELKIKGAVDLKLPCGVEPGPTVQGNALASFKVGPVDVEDAVAEVEYHCAPTVNDTRSFRVYISMPTLTIDGSGTHAELTDVEFDITGTQKPAAAGNATTVAPALGDSKNATANSVSPWTFSGYVKGDAKVTGAAGASAGSLIFKFNTADGSWSAGVDYSFRTTGVVLTLSGETSGGACVPTSAPTQLSGTLDLMLPSIAASAEAHAAHYCQADAPVRTEANVTISSLDVLGGALKIKDVLVTWQALGGSPDGTPMAELHHKGYIRGFVDADFGVSNPGTKLEITAKVECGMSYTPGTASTELAPSDESAALAPGASASDADSDSSADAAATPALGMYWTPALLGDADADAAAADPAATSATEDAAAKAAAKAKRDAAKKKFESESGIKILDPVVDVRAYLKINGTMPAGSPPMLDLELAGRFAPSRVEPLKAHGNGTIRFPGAAEGDSPAELNVKINAVMYGAHIPTAVSDGKVIEISASLDSGGGMIYGFTIKTLQVLATFKKAKSSLETGNLIEGDAQSLVEDDGTAGITSDDEKAPTPSNVVASGAKKPIASGGSEATFPALSFDMKDTEGVVDVYADVALDATQLANSIGSMPDGLDASARIIWKGRMEKGATVDAAWKVVESNITVSAAISYENDVMDMQLRGSGSTACDKSPTANPWDLSGSIHVKPLDLELLLAATYACSTRDLHATVNVTTMSVALGGDMSFNVRNVELDLQARIIQFPGEKKDAATGATVAALGQVAAAAAAEGGGKENAEIDWTLTASGEMSFVKGAAGAPNIDVRALIHVVMSNIGEKKPGDGASATPADAALGAAAEAMSDEKNATKPSWLREASVDVFFDYSMNGIDVSATASYAYPCTTHATGNATLTFDKDQTGIDTGPIEAFLNVSCTNSTTEPFVSILGKVHQLRITDATVIEDITVEVKGWYVEGGQKRWYVHLHTGTGDQITVDLSNVEAENDAKMEKQAAIAAAPKSSISEDEAEAEEQTLAVSDDDVDDVAELGDDEDDDDEAAEMDAANAAAPPAESPLAFDADMKMDILTAKPGKKHAKTEVNVTATAKMMYQNKNIKVDVVGSLRLGKCPADGTPRMNLAGTVDLVLGKGGAMPLYAKAVVECVDAKDKAAGITSGAPETPPNDSILKETDPEKDKIKSANATTPTTGVNFTMGLASPSEIIPGVLSVTKLMVDLKTKIPLESKATTGADKPDADKPKIWMDGYAEGAGAVIGAFPGAEGLDMKGSQVAFNVSFGTDAKGNFAVKKFYLKLEIEIKYWMDGSGGDKASLGYQRNALLGLPGDGAVYHTKHDIARLGNGDNPPNIHARAVVDVVYPCGLGERMRMSMSLAARFGEMHIPEIPISMTYNCKQNGTVLPAYTIYGNRDVPAEIAPGIVLDAFTLDVKAFVIDVNETAYVGRVKGQMGIDTSKVASLGANINAFVLYEFNSILGQYGFVAKVQFANDYINAEISVQTASSGGGCEPKGNATAALGGSVRPQTIHEAHVAKLGQQNISHSQFSNVEPFNYSDVKDDGGFKLSMSASLELKIPGVTEMHASMKGWMVCSVDNGTKPILEMDAWINKADIAVGPNFVIVLQRIGLNVKGYRAMDDDDYTLATAADIKGLSYKVHFRGDVSFLASKGLPEIGQGGASPGDEPDADAQDVVEQSEEAGADVNGVTAHADVHLTFDQNSAHVDDAIVTANVWYHSGDPEKPTVLVHGQAVFVYPCAPGAQIVANVTVLVDMPPLALNATAVLSIPCNRRPRDPVGNFHMEIPLLTVDGVTVTNVILDATVYKYPSGYSLTGSISGQVAAKLAAQAASLGRPHWRDAMKHHDMEAALGGELGASVSFIFDTHLGTFSASVDIVFEMGPLELRISASASSECDIDYGNRLTGNATLDLGGSRLVAGVSATHYCGVDYAYHMRAQNAPPVPVAPRYADAFIDMLAPPGSGNYFPKCVDRTGLCGPWFGGRVCASEYYCNAEGKCVHGVDAVSDDQKVSALGHSPGWLHPECCHGTSDYAHLTGVEGEVLQREVADGRGREAVRVLAVVRRRQRRRVVILRGSGVHSAGTQVPRSRARAPVARRAHARAVLGEGTPRLDYVAGEARARGARSGDRARRRDGRAAGVRRGRRAGAGECRRGCAIAGGAREFQQQLRRRVLALQRGQHVWPEARRNRLPWFLRMRRGERRVRPVFGRDPAAEECHGPDVQVFEQLRHAVHRRVVRAR